MKRKTEDEYQMITNYGYGEEAELTESSRIEIKQRIKEYRQNASGLISIRIKKVRIKIEETKIEGE